MILGRPCLSLNVQSLQYVIGDKKILNALSFDTPEKGFVSIIGPNGAGKSTLLKILAGVYEKSSGSVSYFGSDLAESYALFSFVPQNLPVQKGYDGWDLLECYFYPHISRLGNLSSEQKEKAFELFKKFQVDDLVGRDLTTLSGGELQRTYLACALFPKPKLLLLDEAFSAMDPHIQEENLELIKKTQREEDLLVLHVSHQVNSALNISDRILAIKNGEIFLYDEASNFSKDKINLLFDYEFTYLDHPESGRPLMIPRGIHEG